MYEVTFSRAGVDEGVVSVTGIPAPTSVDIEDLVTGSGYTFKVRAINSVGDGAQSENSVEVILVPGPFTQSPTLELTSLAAGHVGTATLDMTLSNPLPGDGMIFLQFPPEFESIASDAVTASSGLEGGFEVSVAADGYTVEVQRSGGGAQAPAESAISITLNGVTNQLFEGSSSPFPLVKTTLSDGTTSIDEASSSFNPGGLPGAVVFVPAAFSASPQVVRGNLAAGHVGTATLDMTLSNPLPGDGMIFLQFPPEFESIASDAVTASSGLEGGFEVSVAADGYTVEVQRSGGGAQAPAESAISITLNGVTNQLFEGSSSPFPLVKTTLSDGTTSIDEASSSFDPGGLPGAVVFVPAAFSASPQVVRGNLAAGHVGTATLDMTLSNPLPGDGMIFLQFPPEFESIASDAVTASSGLEGGFEVSVAADGYTVEVQRSGGGAQAPAESAISITLNGVTNQLFEGSSSPFPLVKTTLSDGTTSIDEASSSFNPGGLPGAVVFVPAAFSASPQVVRGNLAAGHVGTATLDMTLSNPLPGDGMIFLQFPPEFESIASDAVTASSGLEGGFEVSVAADGYTVEVQRSGGGAQAPAESAISITLNGVTNQLFEGSSSPFPLVKTTLSDGTTSIDEASSSFNPGGLPGAVVFVPAAFSASPQVVRGNLAAGHVGTATLDMTLSNPLPGDGMIFLQFPPEFESIASDAVTASSGLEGGFEVSVAADGYTVEVQRSGGGAQAPAESAISITLNGIRNQLFEGSSSPFPFVKTTLANPDVTIDDSRRGTEMDPFFFSAASLYNGDASLQYDVAGMETAISFSFTIVNPLPVHAVLFLEFSSGFLSVSPLLAESDEMGPLAVSGSFELSIGRDGSGNIIPEDTEISVTLSTVMNRDSVGDTGEFTITTFTDSSMQHRIDVGVAPSIAVGKQLLSMSAAFGSSSVAVAGQDKRWTFFGHGVALGDQVRWVDSIAARDADCNDWGAQEIDVDGIDGDSSTTSVVFAEGSEQTGPLQLCYRFSTGDHPFKLYPAITVDVYEVYSILAAEEGSTSLSVAEYAKVLTLSGFGIAEFDEIRWLLEGSTDCSSALYVAPLAYGGDVGDNSALITSTFQASFEFTKDIFTQAATESTSASATLCYKFGSEEFQHYPSISMGIHYVNGWTSTVGSSSVAVVGVAEDLSFTGYGISESDVSLDRARWILSGTDCSTNAAPISDTTATDGRVDVVGGQATFTFMSSVSGETPALCYWFQDEPGVYLSSLTIDVAYLSSLSAPYFGDADVAVVGYPKSWRFAGGHIENGDFVRWIYDESSDCSDTSSLPEVHEDGEIVSGETASTFAETVAGHWVTPCYRHSEEPWRRYSMPVYVKMVHSMRASWGGDSSCVVDQAKEWTFGGDGLTASGSTDLIKFVVDDTDCANSTDAPLTGADEDGVAMYLEADSTSTFTFESAAAGHFLNLCYKFGNEEFMWYDIQTFAHMVQFVESQVGGRDIAVVDVEEVLVVQAHGTSSQDFMRWVASSEASDAACSDGVLVRDSPDEGANNITDMPIYEEGGYFLASFTFSAFSAGSSPTLCYKFADEPWKVYVDVTINVAMLQDVHANEGSDKVAVVDYPKMWTLVGTFLEAVLHLDLSCTYATNLTAGLDRVKWIDGDNCSADGIVGDVEDSKEIFDFDLVYFDATGFTAQTIVFPEAEIGGPYAMCYSFEEEPYQIYEDLVMTVLGISDVTAEAGAADTIVVGAPKRLYFTGGGAVEAGDQAVWVSGGKVDSDCLVAVFLSGPQSTVDAQNGADFLIPEEDGEDKAGQTWTLCYRFGTESFKIYTSFSLSAMRLVGFSAVAGSDDDSVVEYPKTFHPSGPGVAEDDLAKWVLDPADAGCEADGVVDAAVVEWIPSTPLEATTEVSTTENSTSSAESLLPMLSSTFTFTTPTFSSARVQLCYKHQDEPYHLHPSITLRTRKLLSATIRELGIEQALKSITNSPQAIAFVAIGGMEGDRYKWVTTTTNFSAESLIGLCADDVDPAAGSSIGISAGFYQEASFTFSEPASGLMICYAPGSEPFMPYPGITMEVLAPTISSANTTHVIVGRSTPVRLIGTFGITSGDALKLASNADGDCTGKAAGGDETVFYPDATETGYSATELGTSTISIRVSDRTEESRPYKLCYRFGTMGAWELFDNVSLEAFEISGVTVGGGHGSPAAGDTLDFAFSGTGIVDGDLAKWAGADSTFSDSECEDAPYAAGSSTATVVGGVAQFEFDGDVEAWVLCYKHGSNIWRLYTGIVPQSASNALSGDTEVVSDTQRTRAEVSFTMEGDISSYPEGSEARTTFLEAFVSDLSGALGVDSSRFTITGMRGGSVVIDFTVEPTGSLADPSVAEILADLDDQMSDEDSILQTGDVTSAAKWLTYSTSMVEEPISIGSTPTAIGLSVVEYQPKGLFGFTSVVWYTTEASGAIALTIERNHGHKGVMDVGYNTLDGSATGGDDYTSVTGTVRFYDGETSKTVDISLVDDTDIEAHFEWFTVSLSLEGPINEGAGLMSTATEATVILYDFGDGLALATATFSAKAQVSSSSEASGVVDLALGWTITDNGGQGGWVDANGFAAKDAVVGADEYDDRCDYAATAPCDHDCTFGGGLAELFPTTGESPSVVHLNSAGYVTTIDPVTDFPSQTVSISFWIRADSASGGRGGGTVVSYVAPGGSPSDSEILLHNLNELSLIVHGKYVFAADRYDGPSGGDLGGINTGIDVARDGAWHHVAVAWRSADGRVDAFLDGARVFDGGPYKTGAILAAGGRLVLGQAQSSDCVSADNFSSTLGPLECEIVSGQAGPGGLEAQVQHLRLWSKFVTADEVAQQMHEPFQGNSVGQFLHWDFTPARIKDRLVEDSSGVGVSTSGTANRGLLAESGIELVQASPSLNPGYPCGVVHSGIWRFAGSEEFVAGLRTSTAYGGRLQFRLAYSAAIGDIRPTRGAVVIRSQGGQEISWNLVFDLARASPGQWTHISVVLREDHGWLHEPFGTAVSTDEMKGILGSASDMLIRGDLRVYGSGGGGMEVVYLQDVRLLSKA
eukprot:g5346.t2